VARDENGFWAISARCTHLGCATNTVDWGFVCPCHGSKFDPHGNVLVGPATRALPWFKLSLAPDGSLMLDIREQVPPGTVLKV
jgi:cytochrome b6-f complex iron-sulfur subunit